MTPGTKTVVYPVRDLAQAKLYGTLLGVAPSMDEAHYVGFSVGDQEVGLDPHGHSQGMTGPVSYWHIDDIKETLRSPLDNWRRRAATDQRCRWGHVDRSCERCRLQHCRTHPVTVTARLDDRFQGVSGRRPAVIV